jgi:hypothetical protein
MRVQESRSSADGLASLSKEDLQMFNSRKLVLAAVVALLVSLSVTSAAPAAPSRDRLAAGTASCTVSGNVVDVTGLPTDYVVNFMVSDAGGTYGWVLGYSIEGALSVPVPTRTGPTTYEFASTTYSKDGSKYLVYASCSAS